MGLIRRFRDSIKTIQKQNYELIWAKTWDDTRRGLKWMDDLPGISPGRWAVGYNYLYVMTRVLNEKKPRRVLDLGLGISSTLISQYFKGNAITDGVHDVIEQDENWIGFYHTNNRISEATDIHKVDMVEKELQGIRYHAYKDISPIVGGGKIRCDLCRRAMGIDRTLEKRYC